MTTAKLTPALIDDHARRLLGSHYPHTDWSTLCEPVREAYRRIAIQVHDAGFAPIAGRTARSAAAVMISDHALMPWDWPVRCRCGWDGSDIQHPGHVAERLADAGALRDAS